LCLRLTAHVARPTGRSISARWAASTPWPDAEHVPPDTGVVFGVGSTIVGGAVGSAAGSALASVVGAGAGVGVAVAVAAGVGAGVGVAGTGVSVGTTGTGVFVGASTSGVYNSADAVNLCPLISPPTSSTDPSCRTEAVCEFRGTAIDSPSENRFFSGL